MKERKTPSVVDVQHQIRANASQLQDYFSDLYAWEKSIGKEDSARKRAAKTPKTSATTNGATPPPRTARVVGVGINDAAVGTANGKKPDAHTYDKGYKRWEKFDVDAALREADDDSNAEAKSEGTTPPLQKSPAPRRVVAASKTASSPATTKSREELEREEGNAHYKRGDYVAAIKSYTRCLGYNPQNAVVLSNRAMAYLKNREFANAEDDCTLALKADPAHVKSYSRRGTARNSLGKHRLALLDFYQAATLDPKSRQIQTQLQSTRELIRTAIKRAPKRTEFAIEMVGESPPSKLLGSEHDSENKENLGSRLQTKSTAAAAVTKQKSPLQEANPTEQPPATSSTPTAAETGNKPTKKTTSAILPKLPKKAPATSYEFGRVWKSLALRGDPDHKRRLTNLRAEYLRMIDPSAVRTIFKSAIESDVLCEIFHIFRHAVLSSSDSGAPEQKENTAFVLAFARELTKVNRFNMTIMLLSDKEKEDMAWVISRFEGEPHSREVADLKRLYELS